MQFTYHTAYEITKQRAREAEARAQMEELLRQAGVEPQSWLSWLVGRVLSGVGHRLVVWGQRLEQVGRPQPVCVEQPLCTQR